ncbi:AEC family transporter [Ferrimonas pelagia]|uniref:AEC family transporter n=1 Tax=Ferrimonas pelagia TaxID=1177826 RepID=A0ABP9EEV0_9GAMM
MFSTIAAILFPLFAVVLCGYGLAKTVAPDFSPLNRINMAVCVPALIFTSLLQLDLTRGLYGPLLQAGLIALLLPGLLLWPLCHWLNQPFRLWAPLNMFRNAGNLAIPLYAFAFGEAAQDAAVLLFAVSALLHMTVGLLIYQGRFSIRSLFSSPLAPSALLAIAINLLQIPVWPPIVQSAELAGQAAIPLMLIALGGQLSQLRWSGLYLGLLGTGISLLTGAVSFGLIYWWIPLPTLHLQMMLLFAMLPPAVMNYLFAERYNIEPQKASNIILFGNFLSVITLPILLMVAFALAG